MPTPRTHSSQGNERSRLPHPDPIQFCRSLFNTLDLDPLYEVLYEADLPPGIYRRWLLAYWIVYSSGWASVLSEIERPRDYWDRLLTVTARGAERRHMRGKLFKMTIDRLSERFVYPEAVVDYLITGNAEETYRRARGLTGFGDWISWKICDMLESLSFQNSYLSHPRYLYDSAIGGMGMFCRYFGIEGEDWYQRLTQRMNELLGGLARPRCVRLRDLPEWETCWCKFASKTYWIGKDIHDIGTSLSSVNSRVGRLLFEVHQSFWGPEGRIPLQHTDTGRPLQLRSVD